MQPGTITQQRRVIGVSALVTFGVVYFAGLAKGQELPTARFLIGIGMAFTITSIATDLGSPIGGGFAVLIMLAAIFTQGEDALALLIARAEKPSQAKRRRRRATETSGVAPADTERAKRRLTQGELDFFSDTTPVFGTP